MTDKWAEARRNAIESAKHVAGKTVVSVTNDERELTLKFSDGTILEIGCGMYANRDNCGDHAELEYDLTLPKEGA
ncbi:hypothetical protein [Burkholderia phage BCSR5]|nr:hypothetical protein [Burkholderia phage BCSR5]